MDRQRRALVAGASGYLGGYIVRELKARGYFIRVLVRSAKQAAVFANLADDVFVGQVTQPQTLKGIADDMGLVFTTVGITRQRDGFSYRDVDYQGNLNLLNESLASGADRFLYVSVLNGQRLRQIKLIDAKESFVDELLASPIPATVIRPTGFFSDMKEFLTLARKGTVYLLGNGEQKLNPIAGADLAKVCVDAAENGETELQVGGPEVLTHNEIAQLAFAALGKPARIRHLPVWFTRSVRGFLRTFTPLSVYGPAEFFLTAMEESHIAPAHGSHRLKDLYAEMALKEQQA